jgi:transcriptional regulator with XRE-family HTH domain
METNREEGKVVIKSIGKAMQFWRKLEGYDQKEFSDIIETSRSYVAKLENGHVGVSINRINDIAVALGISPYTLMRGVPSSEETIDLLDLYSDNELQLTKHELENLFNQRIVGQEIPRDYYLHMLEVIRKGNFGLKN